MEIAIVGLGIAGANILRTILKHENFDKADKITIYEKRKQLGVGLPYENDSPVKMLNIPYEEISLDKDNPDDFSQWLEENLEDPINFEGLASRVACGHYIEDRMEKYFNHDQVETVHEEVCQLIYLEEECKYNIITKSGQEKIFDAAFLCIGHPIYNDFYDLRGKENYIHNSYPMVDKLRKIEENKKVGIIGSGPTGIDIYRYLAQEKDMENPPTFLIRKDIFNLSGISLERDHYSFSMNWDWFNEKKNMNDQGLIPLDDILTVVKDDFDKENIDILEVYHRAKDMGLENQKKLLENNDQEVAFLVKYFEDFVPFYPALYGSLSGLDRLEFKEKYEPILNIFRSFNPPGTNKWLIDQIESGNLKVLYGLKEIEYSGESYKITGNEAIKIDVVINATGFNKNLLDNVKENDLLRSLYDQNLILSDLKGEGVLVNWPQCQVLNKKYGLMENLFFQGMWIGASHYRNNDIRSILVVSEYVANNFMENRK